MKWKHCTAGTSQGDFFFWAFCTIPVFPLHTFAELLLHLYMSLGFSGIPQHSYGAFSSLERKSFPPNTSLILHRGSGSQSRATGIRDGFPTLVFQALTFPAVKSLGIYALLAVLPLLTLSCMQPDRKRALPGWKLSVGSWLSQEIVSMPGEHCSEWDEHLFPG